MIKLTDLVKTYHTVSRTVYALDKVSLVIPSGSFTAIAGHSGCGKTTLLNILAGYDEYDSGYYFLDDTLMNKGKDFMREGIFTIFQQPSLLPYMNVYENIAMAIRYRHEKVERKYLDELLSRVGLKGYGNFYPHQLSGGQKQRVAIARVLAGNPSMILADEPTGALDKQNALKIMEIFRKLNDDGITIIMVTHDREMAEKADRIIYMEDGHVVD